MMQRIKQLISKILKHPDQIKFGSILVLSAFLLFYKITQRTLWMDETASLEYYFNSSGPVNFLVNYFRTPDNHAPLYYFLVIIIYNLFPFGEIGIRLLSVLAGLGIVVLVYRFSLLLFADKKIARIAMLLTAISSYFILISQMARYHSLSAFFSLLYLYYFSKIILNGHSRKNYISFILSGILVSFTDYPHFIYVVLVANLYYFYKYLIKNERIINLRDWLISQTVLLLAFMPMIYLIYLRILHGDGGFEKVSLLGRSFINYAADLIIHFYAFFFGENILPWNWFPFSLGVLVLLVVGFYLIKSIFKKESPQGLYLILYYFFSVIVINTAFMNYADPRYNFIVYPKYGFVAFPLFIISLAAIINLIISKKVKYIILTAVIIVDLFGLVNFYQAKNYLNASYFNNFNGFQFVRDNSMPGDYLAINGDANIGVYDFYRTKYFAKIKSISTANVDMIEKKARLWFFATGSDEGGNSDPKSKIPEGFAVITRYESVPLDPTLKILKEKILNRSSYNYKYTVFLLQKI